MTRERPYVLVLTSHKGGTGRSTAAVALAWVWSRQGVRVGLIDADPAGAARLMTAAPDGESRWENVSLESSVHRALARRERDVVLVDAPALSEPACRRALEQADGVILTLLPDLMALRTLPSATAAVAAACDARPELEFLGLLLQRSRPDALQDKIRQELTRQAGDLFLQPEVPDDVALLAWPFSEGPDMPEGPARQAYWRLAEELGVRLGLLTTV